MKAILPTQGQSTVSPARSYCELQQLMSLMENSCTKPSAADSVVFQQAALSRSSAGTRGAGTEH